VRRASRTGVRGCREEGGHVCEGAKRLGGRTGPVGCMGRVGRGQDAWGGRQDTSGRQKVSVGVQDTLVGRLETSVGRQDKWAARQHIWWLERCVQWERHVSGGPGRVVGGLDVLGCGWHVCMWEDMRTGMPAHMFSRKHMHTSWLGMCGRCGGGLWTMWVGGDAGR